MLKNPKNLIIFLPKIDANENWEMITDVVLEDIRPYYYISDYGRIFSAISNRLLIPTIATTGYNVVSLGKNDGTRETVYVHRAVMLTFNYIQGCESLQVNHDDGIKINNVIDNFEWVTIAENVEHASKNGLLLTGEDAPWTKVTDKQVHEICKLYIQGYGITEISRIIDCGVDSVFNIIHGNNRTDISSNYDIVLRAKNHFTDDQVHFMCKVFSEYKEDDFEFAYTIICDNLKINPTVNERKYIRRIYTKNPSTYSRITSQYDY